MCGFKVSENSLTLTGVLPLVLWWGSCEYLLPANTHAHTHTHTPALFPPDALMLWEICKLFCFWNPQRAGECSMSGVIVAWEDEWDGAPVCKFTVLLLTFQLSPWHSGLLASLKPHFASLHFPYKFIDAHAAAPRCGCCKMVMRLLIKVNGGQIHGWCAHCPLLSRYCTLLHTVFYCVLYYRGVVE